MTSPSKSQLIQFYPSATHRQQSLAFDAVDLQGMTVTERANVLTHLARLLLQAAGVRTEEAINDEC
jgi:hypothetical protein